MPESRENSMRPQNSINTANHFLFINETQVAVADCRDCLQNPVYGEDILIVPACARKRVIFSCSPTVGIF